MAKQFTEKQQEAINLLGIPKDERWIVDDKTGEKIKQLKTLGEISDYLEIHRNTLLLWRQDEDFNKAVKEFAVKYTTKDAAEVFAAIAKKAIDGSGKHAELFMKLHGVSKEEKTVHNIHEDRTLNPDEIKEKAKQYAERVNGDVAH